VGQALSSTNTEVSQALKLTHTHTHTTKFTSSGNTSHSGRRVLRSGGLNHSKLLCAFRVHTSLDLAFLGFPQTYPKLGLGGCTPPPDWRNPPIFGMPGRGIGLVCARSRLLITMPRVVEHHDHPMGEEVASSALHASRHPPSRVVAPVAPQRAAGQASRALSQPVQNGLLMAARELLHNPPDTAASPDVLRQWRDDVDRLLNLAQVTPGSAGGFVCRQHHREGDASGSVHSPTVRSARTEDLLVELNRRRAGEDARVTIERARVRRLNIEGWNLVAELDAAVPKLQGLAQAPVAGVGCAALTDHLRAVAWLSKFRPHLLEKYDGSTNPSEFLQVYITTITATGGNDAVMASYFHEALTGPARTWLMNLTQDPSNPGESSACSSRRTSPACISSMAWRPTSTL
jgi:hypothetical protein